MRQVFGQIDSDEIFDELCLAQNFIKENISKLNEFDFSLFGTSATAERLFQ
jgi:hypothetical protein